MEVLQSNPNAEQFPAYLLSQVFGYLSPADLKQQRRVCKRWNEILNVRSCQFVKSSAVDFQIREILEVGEDLKDFFWEKLIFRNEIINGWLILEVGRIFKTENISIIDLTIINSEDKMVFFDILLFLSKFPKLSELLLNINNVFRINANDIQVLPNFGQNLRSLTVIYSDHGQEVELNEMEPENLPEAFILDSIWPNNFFYAAARMVRNKLRNLTIHYKPNAADPFLLATYNSVVHLAVVNLNTLEKLKYNFQRIQPIFNWDLPALKCMDLSLRTHNYNSDVITNLIHNNRDIIVELDFTGLNQPNNIDLAETIIRDMKPIVEDLVNLKNLKSLAIGKVPILGKKLELLPSLIKLEELRIEHFCLNNNLETSQKLFFDKPVIPLKNIKKLELSRLHIKQLYTSPLPYLICIFPNITHLAIDSNTEKNFEGKFYPIKDADIHAIFLNLSFLQCLRLGNCQNLTDGALDQSWMTPLKQFLFTDNNAIQPRMIQKYRDGYICKNEESKSLASLKSLKELCIKGRCNFTNKGLGIFKFQELSHLELPRCDLVTIEGLRKIAANNPSLEVLIVPPSIKLKVAGIFEVKQLILRIKNWCLEANGVDVEEIDDDGDLTHVVLTSMGILAVGAMLLTILMI